MTVDYISNVDYLHRLPHREVKPGLNRIKALLKQTGHPERKFDSVHVAGTNGKGSVVALLSSTLKQKYKVGTFVSPPLIDFRDRIFINGDKISEDDLSNTLAQVKPAIERLRKERQTPTLFEVSTALAAMYFAQKNVDLGILEVGLGGRFDATNPVGNPLLSVITNVEKEHQDILGPKLTDIASEIAGIIKENRPTAVGEKSGRAFEILKVECSKKNSPLVLTGEKIRVQLRDFDWNKSRYLIQQHPFESMVNQMLTTPLLGTFQEKNISTCLTCLEILRNSNFPLGKKQILDGFEKVDFQGRFQLIARKPYVVIDGAHNFPASKILAQELKRYRLLLNEESKIRVVFSALSDKQVSKMLKELSASVDEIVITELENSRAARLDRLTKAAEKQDLDYQAVSKPDQAITETISNSSPEDMICITGSLYLVREAIKHGFKNESR